MTMREPEAIFSDLRACLRQANKALAAIGLESGEGFHAIGTFEPGGLSRAEIAKLEKGLGMALPISLSCALQDYNFSRLGIGSTDFFSIRENYGEALLVHNTKMDWWNGSLWHGPLDDQTSRPREWLLLATGDPYNLLLNMVSGSVYAWDNEKPWADSEYVAEDILSAVQGLAMLWTAFIYKQDVGAVLDDVLAMTNGHGGFWRSHTRVP